MCQPLSRRQVLAYGALVAATFAAPAFASVPRAVPMNLELVTVSDHEAALTWFTGDPTRLDAFHRPAPAPADTTFYLGASPRALERVAIGGETAYHRVDLSGLLPGTTYHYRAESAGQTATPSSVDYGELPATGSFTTLVPPPGRELARVAWLNDVHYGEQVSGLALSVPGAPGGGFPPGFPVDPADPYWHFMLVTSLIEAKRRGATHMFVNGDVSNAAEPRWLHQAKALFDGFGHYRRDYFVTRGNHDRDESGTADTDQSYNACPRAGALHDCMAETFFPNGVSHFAAPVAGRRFIGLDSIGPPPSSGASPTYGTANLSSDFDYLEAELAAAASEPTFVLFHHPASTEAGLTFPGGAIPGYISLPPDQAARFARIVASHPQVVGVYNGHTHRNFTSVGTGSGNVPFMEFGATKEYPGGYTMLRLFEGGYMVNFWKAGGALAPPDLAERCRMWSERSRGEYLGLYPYATLGRLSDRNHVVTHALAGAPASTKGGDPTVSGEPPRPSGSGRPASGHPSRSNEKPTPVLLDLDGVQAAQAASMDGSTATGSSATGSSATGSSAAGGGSAGNGSVGSGSVGSGSVGSGSLGGDAGLRAGSAASAPVSSPGGETALSLSPPGHGVRPHDQDWVTLGAAGAFATAVVTALRRRDRLVPAQVPEPPPER